VERRFIIDHTPPHWSSDTIGLSIFRQLFGNKIE
jgi:hypothetical protein